MSQPAIARRRPVGLTVAVAVALFAVSMPTGVGPLIVAVVTLAAGITVLGSTVDRYARPLLVAGVLMLAVGLVLLAGMSSDETTVDVGPAPAPAWQGPVAAR